MYLINMPKTTVEMGNEEHMQQRTLHQYEGKEHTHTDIHGDGHGLSLQEEKPP